MNSISFPPGKLFGKLNPEFLEERRVKLAQYLAEVRRRRRCCCCREACRRCSFAAHRTRRY